MGCGEQNMILFTPNIYVTQYLEATNQLDPAFKVKAMNFMKSGWSLLAPISIISSFAKIKIIIPVVHVVGFRCILFY